LSDVLQVYTPIGTRIVIKLIHYWGEAMNIDIFMAPKDRNNIDGLCGNFDGNPSNDLLHRDGVTMSQTVTTRRGHHIEFANTWR